MAYCSRDIVVLEGSKELEEYGHWNVVVESGKSRTSECQLWRQGMPRHHHLLLLLHILYRICLVSSFSLINGQLYKIQGIRSCKFKFLSQSAYFLISTPAPNCSQTSQNGSQSSIYRPDINLPLRTGFRCHICWTQKSSSGSDPIEHQCSSLERVGSKPVSTESRPVSTIKWDFPIRIGSPLKLWKSSPSSYVDLCFSM